MTFNETLLRRELHALLTGGGAHMDFEEAVAGFPVALINATPPSIPYSAWHFIEHMRIAQWDVLEFIRNPGHVSPDYPAGYRPAASRKADEALWHQTIARFRADLRALMEMALDPGVDLFTPLPHAPGYTVLRELLVIADHNAYHLGELALLRQELGAWPQGMDYLTGEGNAAGND